MAGERLGVGSILIAETVFKTLRSNPTGDAGGYRLERNAEERGRDRDPAFSNMSDIVRFCGIAAHVVPIGRSVRLIGASSQLLRVSV